MFRRALNALLLLLAFTCAIRLWQYQIFVRLQIFDLLLLAFIATYCARLLTTRVRIPLPGHAWRMALGAKWTVLLVSTATFFQIGAGLDASAHGQFFKGIGNIASHTLGITLMVLWLHEPRALRATSVLKAYVAGAVVSSVYSFAEVMCAHAGFDLGKAIFTRISVFPADFDLSQPFYYPWENFFRAVGFAGVNAQATYAGSMVPLLLVAGPFRRRWTNFLFAALCLAGMALTLSRNGFFTLCIVGVLYLALRPGLAAKMLPKMGAALLPLLALFFFFREPATQLLGTRTGGSFEELASSRSDIVRIVWPVTLHHPVLGHGVNQFSIWIAHPWAIDVSSIAEKYPNQTEQWVRASYANLHNNWLNWFFEGGTLLVLAQLASHGLLVLLCLQRRDRFGVISAAVLISLLISGFFNMTLDLFCTELLFFLLPLCTTLSGGRTSPRDPAHSASCSPFSPFPSRSTGTSA